MVYITRPPSDKAPKDEGIVPKALSIAQTNAGFLKEITVLYLGHPSEVLICDPDLPRFRCPT